ncbi:wall-associated receptor kinase-like 8 [Carica papaya]|uniref:wall-associated receptor kinase-like 8 n=1 Tax=Carica papaya TaxID=3649 RepID=UPI000B8CEDDE|nr:wall-associated receptor kinase-like 8 [Carica papaya]
MACRRHLLLHQILPLLVVLSRGLEAADYEYPMAKPGCRETCEKSRVKIPYPFGIGADCAMAEGFQVTCETSFNTPKPFLTSINRELLHVDLEEATVLVNGPIISSNCENQLVSAENFLLLGSPFFFSDTRNRFTALGCDNLALINRQDKVIGGCLSICNTSTTTSSEDKHSCFGLNCCQTKIPPFLQFINATLRSIDPQNDKKGCRFAFLADQDWFSSQNLDSLFSSRLMEDVPVTLEWSISNGTCISDRAGPYSSTNHAHPDFIVEHLSSSCSVSSRCRNSTALFGRYRCHCRYGFQGNPYLPDGCQDIDECADPRRNYCGKNCINLEGSFFCSDNSKVQHDKAIIIGVCTGLGVLFALVGSWWLYRVAKRRKNLKMKQKFFKRNGGLLLQQQLLSNEGNVPTIKMFTSKELEKATDQFNDNRVLGQGGQGTVYKGMLADGRIVAVKKSKIVDEGKLQEFINEVVILSQISHRNVVKLLGCCLETEVPLLVYEFIPNGTLYQYIHDQNEDFPLTWEIRLRLAIEVASALSYLHSSASVPIYHRDIKSKNILLDEKYRAKVSDFGTSRSISVDQTHLTTRVQGTFGYLDPEYFQSSQFTEKSDVYSFGVVLAELLTGKKPISLVRSEEEKALATHFLLAMEENRLFEIVDVRVLKGGKEEVTTVAMIAERCLNLNGKKRPTMKEVAAELEGIRLSSNGAANTVQENGEEYEDPATEMTGPWDATSTSSAPSLDNSTVILSVDVQPLL